MPIIKIQLGKKGLTENFISTLSSAFKTHEVVKIAVHQHKEETTQMAEEIVNKLGNKYTYKIIGFTIIIRKWRKARKALL